MGGYFKPLRRKIGVLTLVVACVLSVGWVRSLTLADQCVLHFPRHVIVVESIHQRLQVQVNDSSTSASPEPFVAFRSNRIEELFILHEDSERQSRWPRFHIGMYGYHYLLLPYAWDVISLTLLSAWFLLSKPRSARPKAITEPIPEKVK